MTDEQIPDEPQWTERQKKIIDLNKANRDIVGRLQQLGLDVDPTGERFEMFAEFLIQIGVIAADQMEEFNLRWVQHFNDRLVKMEVQVVAQMRRAQEQARRAETQAKLGVRPSSGIVVPGVNGRPNGSGRRGKRG